MRTFRRLLVVHGLLLVLPLLGIWYGWVQVEPYRDTAMLHAGILVVVSLCCSGSALLNGGLALLWGRSMWVWYGLTLLLSNGLLVLLARTKLRILRSTLPLDGELQLAMLCGILLTPALVLFLLLMALPPTNAQEAQA